MENLIFNSFNDIIKEKVKEGETMENSKRSEKLLLEKIAYSAHDLERQQRGLEIGQLIALIRGQLRMSQEVLAKRANVLQSTISKIESGGQQANVNTLQKILNAMDCDLLITAVQRNSAETTRKNQAERKARKKVQYLKGTMSLEKQEPSQELLEELVDDEVKNLLNSKTSRLWEEDF